MGHDMNCPGCNGKGYQWEGEATTVRCPICLNKKKTGLSQEEINQLFESAQERRLEDMIWLSGSR